jgi:hypothetical protein
MEEAYVDYAGSEPNELLLQLLTKQHHRAAEPFR